MVALFDICLEQTVVDSERIKAARAPILTGLEILDIPEGTVELSVRGPEAKRRRRLTQRIRLRHYFLIIDYPSHQVSKDHQL